MIHNIFIYLPLVAYFAWRHPWQYLMVWYGTGQQQHCGLGRYGLGKPHAMHSATTAAWMAFLAATHVTELSKKETHNVKFV
jgi:hypothetical protein